MRTLYLARHGDAAGALAAAGHRQAALLGARMAAVPLTGVFHSPAERAVETATLVAARVDVPVTSSDLLADYPPTDVPGYPAEVPPSPDRGERHWWSSPRPSREPTC